jgi:hypothetical protein
MSLRCGAFPPARLFQYRWSASMLPLDASRLAIPESWSDFQALSSGIDAARQAVEPNVAQG